MWVKTCELVKIKFLLLCKIIHANLHSKNICCDTVSAEAAVRRCSSKYWSVKFRRFHRKIPVLECLFNKVAAFRSAAFWKRDSNTDVFLWNLRWGRGWHILSRFFLMFHFYTLQKRQKSDRVSDVFKGYM